MFRWLGLLAFFVLAGPYALSLARSDSPVDHNGDILGYDFFAFYFAGEMVNADRVDTLYDWTAQRNLQRALVQQWDANIPAYMCPYLNPPHYAWLMSWITPLGYAGALAAWWTLGLAAFGVTLAIWRRWLPHETWRTAAILSIALPAWFQTFAGGQNTYFTVLILTAFGHLLLNKRDFRAGLILALLAYKFQLLAVPLLFLLMTRRWRALLGVALLLAITIALTTLRFGPEIWPAYFRFAAELPNLMQTAGFYAAKQHSWYGFFEIVGHGRWPATMVRGCALLFSGLSVVVLLWILHQHNRRQSPPLANCLSTMLLVAVLASPHLFQYDLLILAPAAVLWRAGAPHASIDRFRVIFPAAIAVVVAWLSLSPRLVEALGIQWTPVLLAIWLVLVVRGEWRGRGPHAQWAC